MPLDQKFDMRSTYQNLDIRTEYTKTFYVDCKYNYDS